MKKVLITGGNTQIPIDKVRVISNVFKGRTAIDIANEFMFLGQRDRLLLTVLGNPGMELNLNYKPYPIRFIGYKTYDQLYDLMEKEINGGDYDVIIHSAAVSDYYVHGTITEDLGEYVDSSTKISSSHEKLFLELRKTRKIVDDIRSLWGFKGQLVKFKLQVGLSDEELLQIARKSRVDSNADIIVANCLEWAKERAYIITNEKEVPVDRGLLPIHLYKELFK